MTRPLVFVEYRHGCMLNLSFVKEITLAVFGEKGCYAVVFDDEAEVEDLLVSEDEAEVIRQAALEKLGIYL